MNGRYLEFHSNGDVTMRSKEDPAIAKARQLQFMRLFDNYQLTNYYGDLQLLLDVKQNLIDEEKYEALCFFRDLEKAYDIPIPFIVRG